MVTPKVSLRQRPSRYDRETAEGRERKGKAAVKGKGETSEMNASRDISSDSGQGQRGEHEVGGVI